MEYKKIIIAAICIIVLCGVCFFAGGIGSGREIRELDTENRELRESVTKYRRTGEQTQENYQRVTAENAILRREIIEGLSGAYDEISDIEQGIQNVADGLGGVLQEMRAYVQENKKAESDNNN